MSADLGVHGLAYLGVALIFTGVLGFVIFAFGDVGDAWRPVAELALPLVCAGSAAFLYRRGAPFVSAALEFLGGLILPIVAVASFVDGAELPPDLDGASLVLVLVVVSLVLAGAYALVVRRRPSSPLRFLAAPMVWLAVAFVGLAFAPVVQDGRDASRPFPIQWALVAATVAATLGLCRLRPAGVIARASVTAAIPGAAVAALLTVLAAPRAGWPAGALVLAGASTIASIELLASRLRPSTVTVLQAITLAGTAATLVPPLGPAWAATIAAIGLLALAEGQAQRRANPPVMLVVLMASGAAAVLALGRPWPTLVTAGVGFVWAVGRRYRPLAGLTEVVPVVGVFVFPALAAVGVVRLLPVDSALVVVGVFVVAVALVVRLTAARRDIVMAVWVPAAAGAVTVAVGVDGVGRPWWGALAAALAAVSFALAPRWACLRVWTTTAAVALAAVWVTVALNVRPANAAVGGAALGLVLVASSLVRRAPAFGHLGLAGLTVGAVSVVVAFGAAAEAAGPTAPWTGPVAASLGLAALGWGVVTAIGETRGCSVRDLIVRLLAGEVERATEYAPATEGDDAQSGAVVAPALALISTVAFVASALGASGLLERSDPWLAVAASGVTLTAAVVARFVAGSRRLLAATWSVLGVWLTAALALLAWSDPWSAAVGSAVVVVAVVAVGPVQRRPSMVWSGWLASAAVALALGRVVGLAADDLLLVLFGWASVAMVGGLAVDDALSGRRRPGEWVRRAELRPGVALGLVVAPLAFLPVFARTPGTFGWWSSAAAIVAFVVAAQLRRGAVSLVGWGLAVVAYLALAPWVPLTIPWTIVPVVAILLVVADMVARFTPTPPAPTEVVVAEAVRPDLPAPPGASSGAAGLSSTEARWDLPPFLVAHAAAALALLAALPQGWVPATWIATGAIGLIVAARLRAWWWAAGGVAVALVGLGGAGPAWLTLGFVVTALGATGVATQARTEARLALQLTGMLAAGAAWVSLSWWQAWTIEEAVVATAIASAAVLAVLAVATRSVGLGLDWLATWAVLPVVGLAYAAVESSSPEVPRRPAQLVVAAALAVASLSVALLASPTGQRWLREASVVLLVAAGALAGGAVELSPTAWVVLSASVAVVAMMGGLALHLTDRALAWRRPARLLAASGTGVALAVAAAELPDRPLLVAALLVAGVELLALGLVTRRAGWLVASTATLVSAWLVFASQALTGDPQWFTVPVGLAVLVMVALIRGDRRRSEADLDSVAPPIVGLDLLGMTFVVGSALLQTVSDSPSFGLLAVALGLGLVVFGGLTGVRRRLFFGAATVAGALVLMVVPPLVGLVDEIRGWVPWALLAGAGMIALLVAAFLEQGRRFVRRTVQRFSELTEGWE